MKNIYFLLIVFILSTGCSSKSANFPNISKSSIDKYDISKVIIKNLTKDGMVFKTTLKTDKRIDVRKGDLAKLVVPTLQAAVKNAKDKGIQYFQIIAPASLSNANGFPINNIADLSSYLVPRLSRPARGYFRIENYFEAHSSINKPLFGDASFEIVIRELKNPKFTDIVWNVEKNL